VKSDPFAPANSPQHVKNLSDAFAPRNGDPEAGRRAELEHKHAASIAAMLDADPNAGPIRNELAELIEAHVTGHELADNVYPVTEELQRRATLVDEYRTQLGEEGPDAEPPAVEDLTGHLYAWREGDRTEDDAEEPSGQPDGETSSGWYFAGEPEEGDPAGSLATPPRNGPGSDTDTWRAFASAATSTEPSEWATMTRGEIIAHLEQNKVIPSEQA
jgi:hypothetical protein